MPFILSGKKATEELIYRMVASVLEQLDLRHLEAATVDSFPTGFAIGWKQSDQILRKIGVAFDSSEYPTCLSIQISGWLAVGEVVKCDYTHILALSVPLEYDDILTGMRKAFNQACAYRPKDLKLVLPPE